MVYYFAYSNQINNSRFRFRLFLEVFLVKWLRWNMEKINVDFEIICDTFGWGMVEVVDKVFEVD